MTKKKDEKPDKGHLPNWLLGGLAAVGVLAVFGSALESHPILVVLVVVLIAGILLASQATRERQQPEPVQPYSFVLQAREIKRLRDQVATLKEQLTAAEAAQQSNGLGGWEKDEPDLWDAERRVLQRRIGELDDQVQTLQAEVHWLRDELSKRGGPPA